VDYEKPMRTVLNDRLSLAQPLQQKRGEAKCSTAASPKLFSFREREREQVSLVTMSRPSTNVDPPPYHWI
jgi:hypothetical protein